jgi:hypothetical protein
MDYTTTITSVIVSSGTVAVAVVALARAASPVWKKFKTFTNSWELFMRDWSGEEARPGHDREPGVMERLNNLDGNFKNNGGSSLKDAVDRIEKKLGQIDKRLDEGNKRFDKIEKELNT